LLGVAQRVSFGYVVRRAACYHSATQLRGTEANPAALKGAVLLIFDYFQGYLRGARRDGVSRISRPVSGLSGVL